MKASRVRKMEQKFYTACAVGNLGDVQKYDVQMCMNPFSQHVLNKGMKNACVGGHFNVITYLINKGVDPNEGIYSAVEAQQLDVVKFLVDSPMMNYERSLLIECACRIEFLDCVKLLVVHGADPEWGMKDACRCGHLDVVEYLIGMGADPNKGFTEACESGQLECVKFLIANGAHYQPQGLELACYQGSLNVVKYLIDNGADPNEGLVGAREGGHVDVLEYLFSVGAGKNVNFLNTLLEYECGRGKLEIIDCLINNGADPNVGLRKICGQHMDLAKLLFGKLSKC